MWKNNINFSYNLISKPTQSMSTQKHQPNSDFIRNIEDAIKEHGNLACPNPECNHKLTSKKRINDNGTTTLEYHCQNDSCFYHKKRQIPIGIATQIAPNDIPFLNTVSYPKIFTVAGFLLIGILAYVSYNLYSVNNYIEKELTEHKENNKKVNQSVARSNSKEKKENFPSQYISNNKSQKEKSAPIDITTFTYQTQTWITSNNFEQGKKNFEKLLKNKAYKSALLQPENSQQRLQLLSLIANSYNQSNSPFTLYLLKNKKDFSLLQDFLKTFEKDQKLKNVLLGKAYLNLPNFITESISISDRKKMQLLSLKYYLESLKDGNQNSYEKSSINAINEIAKAYRIFKHNPKKPRNFLTIEKILKQGKHDMIQYRIEYVESILNRIS